MNKYVIAASFGLSALVIGTALSQLIVHKPVELAKLPTLTVSIEAKQATIIPVRTNQCHNCYQLSIDKGTTLNKKSINKTTEDTTIDKSAHNHSNILPDDTQPNATLIKGKEIIPINLIKIQVTHSTINYTFNTMPGSPNPLPLCGNVSGMSRFKTCNELFNVKINILCNSKNKEYCREINNA